MAAVAKQDVVVDDVDLLEVATKVQYLANTGLYFVAVAEALEAAGMVQSLTAVRYCALVTMASDIVVAVVAVCKPLVAAAAVVAESVVASWGN